MLKSRNRALFSAGTKLSGLYRTGLGTVSGGESVAPRRKCAWSKKIARADHHDIQEKRRLGNADADSTRGHGQMLLSSTGLRRHQQYMQEHIRSSRSTLGA